MANAATPGCSHTYNSPGQGSIPINSASTGPTGASGRKSTLRPLLNYLLR